ncbi:hypothetical protein JCGZ_08701 [Jatropha curcas]|uniref:Uncharacterized protein n=1 Tax=Jatropha curcas TaxID=180498 RepID=A0A067KJX8_JATCU|nr:hypothetical protein JCGZ_08701 [Jatropha curcas]
MENNVGDPLVLPNGPITRSRIKRYGAAMSLYFQVQTTQELHNVAFNKCCEELEGLPRSLPESHEPVTGPPYTVAEKSSLPKFNSDHTIRLAIWCCTTAVHGGFPIQCPSLGLKEGKLRLLPPVSTSIIISRVSMGRHGQITVPGTGTVGSNQPGTVTGTGEKRNWDEPEPEPEKSGSVSVPANEEPDSAVPENRSEPDWNRRFSGRLESPVRTGGSSRCNCQIFKFFFF